MGQPENSESESMKKVGAAVLAVDESEEGTGRGEGGHINLVGPMKPIMSGVPELEMLVIRRLSRPLGRYTLVKVGVLEGSGLLALSCCSFN